MEERSGETDRQEAVDEMGRGVESTVERPAAAKGGRSKQGDDTPAELPIGVESRGPARVGVTTTERPAVLEEHVMGGITIKELEMMPKLAEIRRLKEIPVGGITNIEPEVLGAIAGVAAQAVEGVASLGGTSLRRSLRERVGGAERRARGVSVEVGRREVILDINVRVIYGYSIPTTVSMVRHNVADRLLNLCGLIAKEINIKVVGIEFPSRLPGRVE